jgi:hypothetical protein
MLVFTDEGDDSDRDGTECVRALRGAGAAACGVSLEDPEDDLREIASRGYEGPASPTHVPARLWLSACQPGHRHAHPASVPRPSQHPAHRALHRAVTRALQESSGATEHCERYDLRTSGHEKTLALRNGHKAITSLWIWRWRTDQPA